MTSSSNSPLAEMHSLLESMAERVEERMIAWRRDFHEHPELGNQEVRTSRIVADHLRTIGCDEVREGLGGSTGVIGILKGDRPGPCVALRADMDALPVREETGLDFASKVTGTWGGETVPVMHACGHDAHTAVQMAAAEVLAECREQLVGTLMFVFQPAEEGPAPDWTGLSGAARMVADGAFDDPKPDVFFAMHVLQGEEKGTAGRIKVHRGDGTYGMSMFRLTVTGKGGHGAYPWKTVDPLVIGAQILLGLQTIPAKTVNVYENDVTLSVGIFRGGTKFNVIPETCLLEGALRLTDEAARGDLEARVEKLAVSIAIAHGGTADVDWYQRVPICHNDPALVERMMPTLRRTAGCEEMLVEVDTCFLDDVSNFIQVAPLMFYTVSVALDADDEAESGFHHAPNFMVNEKGLLPALKTVVGLAADCGHLARSNS
ncbi:amidohydrolase [Amorphus sp. 3PC139-8]|uniref:amidohydrolase n=1 Tax=Amorphus sp. 3PC139-8 TaxID=2735676 RepID=UPI00345D3EBD